MFMQHPVTALFEDKGFLCIHGSHFPLWLHPTISSTGNALCPASLPGSQSLLWLISNWNVVSPALHPLRTWQGNSARSGPATWPLCHCLVCLQVPYSFFVWQHEEQDWWPDRVAHHATKSLCQPQKVNLRGLAGTLGWLQPRWVHTSLLPRASIPPIGSQHLLHGVCCSPKASPVFCILHVFVNWVSGGMDSPSPMVTSSTNDMEGTLIFGLSKS